MVRRKKIIRIAGVAALSATLILGSCNTSKQSGVALYVPDKYDEHYPTETVVPRETNKNGKITPDSLTAVLVDREVAIKAEDGNTLRIVVDSAATVVSATAAKHTPAKENNSGKEHKQGKESVPNKTDSDKPDSLLAAVLPAKIVSDSISAFISKTEKDSILNKTVSELDSNQLKDSLFVKKSGVKSDTVVVAVLPKKMVSGSVPVTLEEKNTGNAKHEKLPENNAVSQVIKPADNLKDTISLHSVAAIETLTKPVVDSAYLPAKEMVVTVQKTDSTPSKPTFAQNQATNTGNISRQPAKQYTAATSNAQPRDYLSRQPNGNPQPDNGEKAALRAQVNELTRQNQQLQSTIHGIKSNIDTNRSSQNNDKLLSDISNAVSLLASSMAINAANQSRPADTITREVVVRDTVLKRDTVITTRVVESQKLTVQNEQLKDSLAQMQNYIALKNKALSSLENRLTAPANVDTVLTTAYYAPGKTVSKNEKKLLSELKAKIAGKKVEKVSLIGYTDISGSPQLNLKLSNQRAVRLVDELTKLGFVRESIFLQYFGSQFASGKVVENERRVEIIVETMK